MSESEKEKALVVLRVASETCTVALSALADKSTTRFVDIDSEASIDVRLQDFGSLLSLLYHNTTKLGIALKQSSPTYEASITPAKDLAAHIDALASCACSIDCDRHGRALAREIRWAAEEIISALATLLRLYTDNAETTVVDDTSGGSTSYLAKTGAVHEAVDRARGVARSNREAVRRRWEIVLGGVNDCEREVEDVAEEGREERDDEAERTGDVTDMDDEDADWGELGLPQPSKLDAVKPSSEELARLKYAQHFFKLTHALLKRVSKVLLEGPTPDGTAAASPGMWDGLLLPADAFLEAADEFVNTLYVPQDPSFVSRGLTAVTNPIRDLHVSLSLLGFAERLAPTDDADYLVTQMKLLGIGREVTSVGAGAEEKLARDRKWFDACFAQISKVAGAIVFDPDVPAT